MKFLLIPVLLIVGAVTFEMTIFESEQKSFIDGCNAGLIYQKRVDDQVFRRAPPLPPLPMRTCETIYRGTK